MFTTPAGLMPRRSAAAEVDGDPLHSSTYLDLDSDADELIGQTTAAIRRRRTDHLVEADLETLLLPCRSLESACAVPTPPISAVLTTVVFLRFIGQEPTAQNVMWTLHHYWTDARGEVLGLTDWQRKIDSADSRDVDTLAGLEYLHTWVAAIVDSADGIIA